MQRNVLLITDSCLFTKRFPAGRWSFFGFGSGTRWYSIYNERFGGEWDKVSEQKMIKFGESGHPVFRAASPLSRGTLESNGGGKLSFHFCADGDAVETVSPHNYFCQLVQCPRSSLRFVWWIQRLSSKNRETCCGRAIWSHFSRQQDYWKWHPPCRNSCTRKCVAEIQGICGKAPTTRFFSKTCIDAGFLKVVEVGQYFMKEHIDEDQQVMSDHSNMMFTILWNMGDHSLSHSFRWNNAYTITKWIDDDSDPSRTLLHAFVFFFFLTRCHSDVFVSSHLTLHRCTVPAFVRFWKQ